MARAQVVRHGLGGGAGEGRLGAGREGEGAVEGGGEGEGDEGAVVPGWPERGRARWEVGFERLGEGGGEVEGVAGGGHRGIVVVVSWAGVFFLCVVVMQGTVGWGKLASMGPLRVKLHGRVSGLCFQHGRGGNASIDLEHWCGWRGGGCQSILLPACWLPTTLVETYLSTPRKRQECASQQEIFRWSKGLGKAEECLFLWRHSMRRQVGLKLYSISAYVVCSGRSLQHIGQHCIYCQSIEWGQQQSHVHA